MENIEKAAIVTAACSVVILAVGIITVKIQDKKMDRDYEKLQKRVDETLAATEATMKTLFERKEF